MLDQDPPESHECAVDRALTAFHAVYPALERQETLTRPLGVDSFFLRRGQAMRAEAADGCRTRPAAMTGTERGVERPLPLAAKHEAVDRIRAQVILGQAEPEVHRVRVAVTHAGGGVAMHVNFERLV